MFYCFTSVLRNINSQSDYLPLVGGIINEATLI